VSINPDWERAASEWIAWARTPGHDAYWEFRDAFFALVPPPGRATLEAGCGEGRVTRDLQERGHATTSIDASPTLLRAAQEADPGGRYELADAAALPFGDGEFTAVAMSVVFMFLPDPVAVLRECRRVLVPGGRVAVFTSGPELRGTPAAPEPFASLSRLYDDATLADLALEAGLSRPTVRNDRGGQLLTARA
jgi:ubiquinone/menaquinone biosynthesis C-methylase UbiE